MECDPDDFMCIIDNCSGETGLIGNRLFNYWETHNCPAAYEQAINTSPTGSLAYNPDQQALIQDKVLNLFTTYLSTNQLTDDVTSPAFNSFQFTLLELCTNPALPGICGEFLTVYCDSGICEGQRPQDCREIVANSPTLINFCGCYVAPDPDYLSLTLGSTGCLVGTGCTAGCSPEGPSCVGQPACDPLCHRALTSQRAYDPTGALITCPQNICVIDDVTINATQTTVPGGINFNTICAGCGGADGADGCLCVISGVNISATMAQVGVGINFNQFCGTGSVCLVEDNAGNIISQGGCTGINPINIPVDTYFGPVLGIIAILLLIVLIVLFVSIAARVGT